MSKAAIITAWDSKMNDLAEVTTPNHIKYCEKWGYEYIGQECWFGGQDNIHNSQDAKWLRVGVARDQLSKFDWIVIMDLDILFTNMSIPIEKYLDRELVTTRDRNGLFCGVILMRNTEWTQFFIDYWFHSYMGYKKWPCAEQTSLAYLLICEPQEKWKVIQQKGLDSSPECWSPEDLVLHLPDMYNNDRIKVFKEYLATGKLVNYRQSSFS